jgi:hypothetical protein
MADFLRECMSDIASQIKQSIPIDEFTKSYCIRCLNQDCARSKANGLRFVKRAVNWKEDLFINVPRADEHDSVFDNIRSRQFISANETPGENPGENPVAPPVKPEPEPEPEPEPIVAPPSSLATPDLGNTPFVQGTMVSDKPLKKEVVLEPGQAYTFGSNDQTSKEE